MKRLSFMMVVVTLLTILTLSSCRKEDNLPDANITIPRPPEPITLNLTANRWESQGDGILVNTFAGILTPWDASRWVNVYMVVNSNDLLINQPIHFQDGEIWAAHDLNSVKIFLRNTFVPYLNIKVVIL